MKIEIQVIQANTLPLETAFREAGVGFEHYVRKGFDGVAIATLAVQAVVGIGGIVAPIILHFLTKGKDAQKPNPQIVILIQGTNVSLMTQQQIERHIENVSRTAKDE